jgi:hypothetical protein
MHFIYTERNGAKEYAVLRDACQTQHPQGIIAEAYKQALGNPTFLWPDFYDRLCYDANEARESTGFDRANATMMQLERAFSQPADSPIFKSFREAFRKFLKESK